MMNLSQESKGSIVLEPQQLVFKELKFNEIPTPKKSQESPVILPPHFLSCTTALQNNFWDNQRGKLGWRFPPFLFHFSINLFWVQTGSLPISKSCPISYWEAETRAMLLSMTGPHPCNLYASKDVAAASARPGLRVEPIQWETLEMEIAQETGLGFWRFGLGFWRLVNMCFSQVMILLSRSKTGPGSQGANLWALLYPAESYSSQHP